MGMYIADQNGKWNLDMPIQVPPDPADDLLISEKIEKLSFGFGELEYVQILMPDIYIVYGDMQLKQENFRISISEMPDMIELHFAITGQGEINNQVSGKHYHFLPNQHNIMYIPKFDGLAFYPMNVPYKFFEIHLSKSYFLEQAQNTNRALEQFAANVAGGRETTINQHSCQITFEMHQCLQAIMNCRFKGGLKLVYLQAKCMELLSLQADAFENKKKVSKSVIKTARDKECIFHAKDYLLKHLSTPPSLAELANVTGTNTFKLKNGFKELFGTTVFGYLNEVKLVQAKEMLDSGNVQ